MPGLCAGDVGRRATGYGRTDQVGTQPADQRVVRTTDRYEDAVRELVEQQRPSEYILRMLVHEYGLTQEVAFNVVARSLLRVVC